MRPFVALTALLGAGAAQAHTGHLAEAAGHGHWLGAAAIGAAIAIGLWAGLRGRRGEDDTEQAEADPVEDDAAEA